MNARQLEVFRSIMRNETLTAAAQELNVSQPAISKLLRHFESQLGYLLFERIGNRLIPTPEAHLLFKDADRVFREIEVVKELAGRIKKQKVGLLRIGTSAPPAFSLLPEAIKRFRAKNPEIKVVVHTMSASQVGEEILVGEVDLGLTLSTIHLPKVARETLCTRPVVAVLPSDSPLTHKSSISVADLKDQHLISYGSHAEMGPVLDNVFEENGSRREVSIEISLSISAVPLVAAGLGIGLVDGFVPWGKFQGIVSRPFEPRILLDLCLATPSNRPMSRYCHEFCQILRTLAASMPAD